MGDMAVWCQCAVSAPDEQSECNNCGRSVRRRSSRSRELPSTTPDLARMEQFEKAVDEFKKAAVFYERYGQVGDLTELAAARAALTALYQQAEEQIGQMERIADDHDALCEELAEAQRALVLLANQLERHSIPFVPEAEGATAAARRDVERDATRVTAGMKAARAALQAASTTPNRPEAAGE